MNCRETFTYSNRSNYIFPGVALLAISGLMFHLYHFSLEHGRYSFALITIAIVTLLLGILLVGIQESVVLTKQITYTRSFTWWGIIMRRVVYTAPALSTPVLNVVRWKIKNSTFYRLEISFPGYIQSQIIGAAFDDESQAQSVADEILVWYGGGRVQNVGQANQGSEAGSIKEKPTQ